MSAQATLKKTLKEFDLLASEINLTNLTNSIKCKILKQTQILLSVESNDVTVKSATDII